jgi:hypothetical protein
VKRYGKYRRKVSWIVIRFGKYGKRYGKYEKKASWIVKWYGNMKISHINGNIYEKTATSQQNSN